MAIATMADIITAARVKTNTLGSGYFDDSVEMPIYVNFAVSDVYDRVVAAYDQYFAKHAPFTLTTSNEISLPDIIDPGSENPQSDFYKELGVDYWPNGNALTALTVMPIGSYLERNFGNAWGGAGIYGPVRMYNIIGDTLQILPASANYAGKYVLHYVPNAPIMTVVDDLPVELVRWVKLITLKVAKTMKEKREQPTDEITAAIAQQERRIDEMAHHRIKEGKRIPIRNVNVMGWSGNNGFGGF